MHTGRSWYKDVSPCSRCSQIRLVRIVVRSVDTDVLVLSVALVQKLQEQTQESIQLWAAFGTGTNLRYIPTHEIAKSLGENNALALPAFHAFSGCDTMFCFFGKSKKTALGTWNSFAQITPIFIALSSSPTAIHDDWMQALERYVVLLYNRTSSCLTVDEAWKQLFTRKSRRLDSIPPTRDALLQHVKRTAYQAGHIWGQALIASPLVPSPRHWGWITDSGTTLTEITKSYQELVKCGCKKGCRGGCGCRRVSLRCTALCTCQEECENQSPLLAKTFAHTFLLHEHNRCRTSIHFEQTFMQQTFESVVTRKSKKKLH